MALNALNALHEASLGLTRLEDLDDQELEERKKRKERREAKELSYASSMIDKSEVESCLSILVLALGCLMSGSCDKGTIELLVKMQTRLHPKLTHRTEVGIGMGFGSRLAISMALGFVSMGGGKLSLSSESKEAVACLLISLFPILPSSSADNRHHLQALRHFYVLAAKERRLSCMDVDTGRQVKAQALIVSKNEADTMEDPAAEALSLRVVTPCLLPPARCKGGGVIRVEEAGYFCLEMVMGGGEVASSGSSALQLMIKKRGSTPLLGAEGEGMLPGLGSLEDGGGELTQAYLNSGLFIV